MICFWCAVLPVLCGCSQGGPSLSVARLTPFERPCVETTAGACTLLADRLDCTLGALAATPDGTDSSTTPVNLKTSSTKPAGCHAQGGDPALLWLAAFVLLVLRRKRR